MHRSIHPTLKTYEEFLAQMAKEDESVKRYFFHQIQFAEKERERLRAKNRRGYKRRLARLEATAIAESPAESKVVTE